MFLPRRRPSKFHPLFPSSDDLSILRVCVSTSAVPEQVKSNRVGRAGSSGPSGVVILIDWSVVVAKPAGIPLACELVKQRELDRGQRP